MKKLLLNLIILLCSQLYAQEYNIKFSIQNTDDNTAYLAFYLGEKTYIADTAEATKKGEFLFSGTETLKKGLYMLVNQKKEKVLDFIVDKDQIFQISFDINNPEKTLGCNGSKENKAFFSYITELSRKKKQLSKLLEEKKSSTADHPKLEEKIKNLRNEGNEYVRKQIQEHSNLFFSKFLYAMENIEMPKSDDKELLYSHYLKHYWDNINLSDDRFLHTPFFQQKLDVYLDQVVPQQADSVNKYLDIMLTKAQNTEEMHQYLLWHFLSKYERSQIMTMDGVFVHLAERYLENEAPEWMNKEVRKNIIDRAKELKLTLVGSISQNLIMMDTSNQPVSLHNVNADFKLVYFWNTTCGHCKEETPKLIDFYNELKDSLNLEVFAVNTDTTISRWKSAIRKYNHRWISVNGNLAFTKDFHDLYDIHSTPVIYFLDKENRIIAKKLDTEALRMFLRRRKN